MLVVKRGQKFSSTYRIIENGIAIKADYNVIAMFHWRLKYHKQCCHQ